MDTSEILQGIRNGDQQMIRKIYQANRDKFQVWALKNYAVAPEEIPDIFQEVVLAFYRNVVSGKIDQLESSISTYLFAVGKNLLLKKLDQQKKKLKLEATYVEKEEVERENSNKESSNLKEAVKAALGSLKAPCNKIISLYYYKEYSIEAIQHQLGYKSEATVRNQKKRCMQYLRNAVQDLSKAGKL
ncbi:MAG: sigma-70 family RNA polymerase sigma factor [Bacteroidota bacterium]